MRVRLNQSTTEPRRRSRKLRRAHLRPREEVDPAASDPVPRPDDLADERRLRESGGPTDRAMYTCTCGYVFHADVSTSVACPHCGASQAW
jgi:rubrerythrin